MAAAYGAVARYLAGRFGGLTRESESAVTVGVTVAALVGPNSERVALVFCNQGANDVMISHSASVTTSLGLRLPAGGGIVAMNIEEDAHLPSIGWWAISGGAGNSVVVLEVVREALIEGGQAGEV